MEPSRKHLMSRATLALPTAALLAALLLAACSQTPDALAALESQATFITVTSGADSGDGTLRNAIAQASDGDFIIFDVGTVTLASVLVIDKNLTIAGPYGGSVTVSGDNSTGVNNTGVFHISADTTVELHNLTIKDSYANSGVYNAGRLTVTNSTISGNNAGFGGGIFNSDTGTLTVTNSTISGNTVTASGSTTGGGGILNQTVGTLTLSNSIVALNSAANGADIRNTGSAIGGSNNIVGGNPGLELDANGKPDLAENSGSTKTIALLADSPALDKANGASCPTLDQRGIERPQGSGCDIGAFELEVYFVPIYAFTHHMPAYIALSEENLDALVKMLLW